MLGQLIVRLGLDAAEFTTGLTKSELKAKKFAENLERGISTAATAAGVAIAGIGIAAAGAFVAIDKLTKAASKFKDFEEVTGGSAESLAGLALAAGTAGASMEDISGASVKLTKTLVGVGDESTAAGAALTALGIPIENFKKLDPASQFEAVGKAMANFADGTNKTAIATVLYGKAGAQLLPFLKQLAADGGRTIILTQRQIELADEYADAQARLRTEISLYSQMLAIEASQAVTAFAKTVRDAVGELIGLDRETRKLDGAVIQAFAEKAVTWLGFIVDAADGVSRTFQVVGTSIAAASATTMAVMAGELSVAKSIAIDGIKEVQAILDKPLFSAKLAKNIADARALASAPFPQRPDVRPVVRFTGPVKAAAKVAAEDPDAAVRRILEGEIKKLERAIAQERDALNARESYLSDYYGRGEIAIASYYGQLQAARDKELKNVLGFLDQQIALERQREATAPKAADRIQAGNKINELQDRQNKLIRDAVTAEEQLQRKRQFATEDYLAQIAEINNKILEMNGNTAQAASNRIAAQFKPLLFQAQERGDVQGEANIRILANQATQQARLNDATRDYGLIVDKSYNAFARINLLRDSGAITELESLKRISAANLALLPVLQQQIDMQTTISNGMKAGSPEQLSALQGIDNIKLKMEELATQTNLVADKFNQVFKEGFSEAFLSVIDGTSSVKDAFKSMAKDITASINRIAVQNLAEKLLGKGGSGGFDFGKLIEGWLSGMQGFAMGGNPPMNKWSLVGEDGPELIKPRFASTIVPNDRLGGSNVVNINVNVPQNTSRASASQIARETGAAVARAQRRDG